MDLIDILPEDSVLFGAGIRSKTDLFKLLADHTSRRLGKSSETVLAALETREALASTGIGGGIAVPHGKLPGLPGVVAVFVRLPQPVEFGSVDDEPVDLVMMLLAPQGAGADHLKALARVARILRTERLVDQLRGTGDPARLHALLTAPMATHQAA